MQRSTLLFVLVLLIFTSCFRPPEFSNTPKIALERIRLTDEARLILTIKVRDGDGDLGLQNADDYAQNELPEDLLPPYHKFSFVEDSEGNLVTFNSQNHIGDFYQVPVTQFYELLCLVIDHSSEPKQCLLVDNNGNIIDDGYWGFVPYYAPSGDRTLLSSQDPRPTFYDCQDYELIPYYRFRSDTTYEQGVQGAFIDQSVEIAGYDTVMVVRNELHFNIHVDLEILSNGVFVPIEDVITSIADCDPIYTQRFPVFDKSDFGRPLDGSIDYSLFSPTFEITDGPILQETIRFRIQIFDRAFNASNVVESPGFRILDLRSGDLTF